MDQVHGTQESGAIEKGREAVEPKLLLYRQMVEGSIRLHSLLDPERLVPVVTEVLRHLLGPCPGILVLRSDGQDIHHPFGGRDAEALPVAQVTLSTAKAMDAGQPVVDGQGPARGVAVPLAAGARTLGSLYVAVGDLERRLGTAWLDVLVLLGKHLGTAFDNAYHVRDLSAVGAVAGEEAIPAGLSLSDAKKAFERRLVRARLRDARGNIASAARSLDMDRGQLSRLLKKHGIDKGQYRTGSAGAR